MTQLAKKIRPDFPILTRQINSKPLIYFDNAASTQKPLAVINAMSNFYQTSYANIHRGVYALAEESSLAYEDARQKVANFINAKTSKEIIFTKGTTEAINLVALSLTKLAHLQNLQNSNNTQDTQVLQKLTIKKNDEILLSQMEHHANLVPWQELAASTGAVLKFIPVTANGELDLTNIDDLINAKTKILAITHISNTLGSVNPVKELIAKAHKQKALALIDGAQAAAHLKLDMQDLNADFYAFSGHKLYAPTGIGVLYGKADLLRALPVWQTGGDMVETVDFEATQFADIPHKFEAGTPAIVEAYGLGLAIDYLTQIGLENIAAAEQELLEYAKQKIKQDLPEMQIYGESSTKAGIISFTLPKTGLHPQDIGILLNEYAIAIRTGHHCNIPLLKSMGAGSTARVSFGIYNTKAEIDIWLNSMRKIIQRFAN